VRHIDSGWAGDVVEVGGDLVTVRPTSPRPKQVYVEGNGFVPTPTDWPGWRPLTVRADELERT
jgi:protein involved in polysaccharide export with SLBB domain